MTHEYLQLVNRKTKKTWRPGIGVSSVIVVLCAAPCFKIYYRAKTFKPYIYTEFSIGVFLKVFAK